MKYTYTYNSPSKLTVDKVKNYKTFEKELSEYLKTQSVTSTPEYNKVLSKIKKIASSIPPVTKTSKTFKDELTLIQKKKPLSEPVVWGGVNLKKVDVAKDFIQKLLVVKKFGVLGFEIHKKKKEHLTMLEGYCIVFYINHHGKKNNTITVKLASAGDEFTFAPNDEHGILTLTDCIIEETSTNHLDDLVYIFKATL